MENKNNKTEFENALEAIRKAQNEANAIAVKVLDEMPLGTSINVEYGTLYANSNVYADLCEVYEILKDDEGIFVRTEYDEYIDVHELNDNLYNDVILYIINHS